MFSAICFPFREKSSGRDKAAVGGSTALPEDSAFVILQRRGWTVWRREGDRGRGNCLNGLRETALGCRCNIPEGHWVFMMLLTGYMFCHHTWHHPAHFQDMVVMMPLYLTNKPRQEFLLRIRLYMNDITPVMGSVWCCSFCMLPAAMACMQKYVLLCPHAVKFVTSLISIATSDVIWRLNLHCTQVVGTRQHVWLLSKILP